MGNLKIMKIILTLVLVACLVPVAQADMFTQVAPNTGNIYRLITEYTDRTYTHDLSLATPAVDVFALDIVTSATLTLVLRDDEGCGLSGSDHPEYARVSLDNQSWIDLGEVSTGDYNLTVPVAYLNDDGLLDVKIDVYDNEFGYPTGDIYFDLSTLSGEFTVVPVPAAVLLGLLGLGAAGIKLRRHA